VRPLGFFLLDDLHGVPVLVGVYDLGPAFDQIQLWRLVFPDSVDQLTTACHRRTPLVVPSISSVNEPWDVGAVRRAWRRGFGLGHSACQT
jgi:hypothetical protein